MLYPEEIVILPIGSHIVESTQPLRVCSTGTFNSLLPEELIKRTIDPYNLCTFIKSTAVYSTSD